MTKNSADASGQVPSNQRGKENTVQPAKSKTSGTVKTVADTNASLPDHLVNGDFSVNYHDQWKDSFGGWTSIDPNAGKTLHATSLPNGSSWKWTAINGWDKSKFGWTSTQKAGSNVQQKANAVDSSTTTPPPTTCTRSSAPTRPAQPSTRTSGPCPAPCTRCG